MYLLLLDIGKKVEKMMFKQHIILLFSQWTTTTIKKTLFFSLLCSPVSKFFLIIFTEKYCRLNVSFYLASFFSKID